MATLSAFEQSLPLNPDKAFNVKERNGEQGPGQELMQSTKQNGHCEFGNMDLDNKTGVQEVSTFSMRHFVSSVRGVDISKCWPFQHKILDKCLRIGVQLQLPPFDPHPKHPAPDENCTYMAADGFCVQVSPYPSMTQELSSESQVPCIDLKSTMRSPELSVREEMGSRQDARHIEVEPTDGHGKDLFFSGQSDAAIITCADSVKSHEEIEQRTERDVEVQDMTNSLSNRLHESENSHDNEAGSCDPRTLDCQTEDGDASKSTHAFLHDVSEIGSYTGLTQGVSFPEDIVQACFHGQEGADSLKPLEEANVIELCQGVSDRGCDTLVTPEEATVLCDDGEGHELAEKCKYESADGAPGVNFDALTQVCPVCLNFMSTSNTALNAHIDQCLEAVLPGEIGSQSKFGKGRMKPRKMRSMADICASAPPRTLEDLELSSQKWTFDIEKSMEKASCSLAWKEGTIRRQPRTSLYRQPGWKGKGRVDKETRQQQAFPFMGQELQREGVLKNSSPLEARILNSSAASTSVDADAKLQQFQRPQKSRKDVGPVRSAPTERIRVLGRRKKSESPVFKECISLSSEDRMVSEEFTDCSCSENLGFPGIAPVDTSADEEKRLQQDAHFVGHMPMRACARKVASQQMPNQNFVAAKPRKLLDGTQISALATGGQYFSIKRKGSKYLKTPRLVQNGATRGVSIDEEKTIEDQVERPSKSKRVVPKTKSLLTIATARDNKVVDVSPTINEGLASDMLQNASSDKEVSACQPSSHSKRTCTTVMKGISLREAYYANKHASFDTHLHQRETLGRSSGAVTRVLATNERQDTSSSDFMHPVSPENGFSNCTSSDEGTFGDMRGVRELPTNIETEELCVQEQRTEGSAQLTTNVDSSRRKLDDVGQSMTGQMSHMYDECEPYKNRVDAPKISTYFMSTTAETSKATKLGALHVPKNVTPISKTFATDAHRLVAASMECSKGFDAQGQAQLLPCQKSCSSEGLPCFQYSQALRKQQVLCDVNTRCKASVSSSISDHMPWVASTPQCTGNSEELSAAIARTKITCDGGQKRLASSFSEDIASRENALMNHGHPIESSVRYNRQEAFKNFRGPNPFANVHQPGQACSLNGTHRSLVAIDGTLNANTGSTGAQNFHANLGGRLAASYNGSGSSSSVTFGSNFDPADYDRMVTPNSQKMAFACNPSHMFVENTTSSHDQHRRNILPPNDMEYAHQPIGLLPLEDIASFDGGLGVGSIQRHIALQFVSENTTSTIEDRLPGSFDTSARITDSRINGYGSVGYGGEQGVVHIFGNPVFKLMGKNVMVSNKDSRNENVGHGFDTSTMHCLDCRGLDLLDETRHEYAQTLSDTAVLMSQDVCSPHLGAWHRDPCNPRHMTVRNCVDVDRSLPLTSFRNGECLQYSGSGMRTPINRNSAVNPGRLQSAGDSTTARLLKSNAILAPYNRLHGDAHASMSKRTTLVPALQRGGCPTTQQNGCPIVQQNGVSFSLQNPVFASLEEVHFHELLSQQAHAGPADMLVDTYTPARSATGNIRCRSVPSGTLSDIVQDADQRISRSWTTLPCQAQQMQFRPN